jgi:hypothetical protein
MKTAIVAILGFALGASTPAAALAQPATSFEVPGHGSIVLRLPRGAKPQSRVVPNPAAVYIRFAPENAEYDVQITTVWLDPAKLATARAQLRENVQAMSTDVAAQSVEGGATLVALQGDSSAGHFYTLTDKAPAAGEFKYLTQGVFITGELMSNFTLLERTKPVPERASILDMFRGAAHASVDIAERPRPAPPASAGTTLTVAPPPVPPSTDGVRMVAEGTAIRIARAQGGPALVVDNADSNLTPAPLAGAGPRYFSLKGKDGLLVSGWFEPASDFPGVRKFWQNETAEWKRNGLPAPTNVEFLDFAGWQTVFYGVASPAGVLSHVRAHRIESGVWMDVHLSMTYEMAPEDSKDRLREALAAVRVDAPVK